VSEVRKMVFIFTDALVLTLLLACGTETTSYPVDSEECQPWHETYSHSVTHCGEEQSVYIACNPRVRSGDQVPGCVDDLLLKCFEESEEDCFSENVCMNLWEEEE
tara:strand:- start:779 stop:1093 length:315 start_codon:yes stop_codon:yes gene_type:complete